MGRNKIRCEEIKCFKEVMVFDTLESADRKFAQYVKRQREQLENWLASSSVNFDFIDIYGLRVQELHIMGVHEETEFYCNSYLPPDVDCRREKMYLFESFSHYNVAGLIDLINKKILEFEQRYNGIRCLPNFYTLEKVNIFDEDQLNKTLDESRGCIGLMEEQALKDQVGSLDRGFSKEERAQFEGLWVDNGRRRY